MTFENFVVVYPMDTQGGVLMARKKRKWCEGKLVGFGGKIKPSETVRAATERELNEELNLQAYSMECRLIAVLDNYTSAMPKRIFVLTGKPLEEPGKFLQTLCVDGEEFFPETLRFWDVSRVKPEDLPEGDDLWLPEALKVMGDPLHVQVYKGQSGVSRLQMTVSSFGWNINVAPSR